MQLTDDILDKQYYIVNCSYLKDWENIIRELNFSVSGETLIDDRFGGEINLYYNLPYSALKFQGNYLFVANSVKELWPNKNWFAVRNSKNDIVIDANGNLEYIGF